MQAVNREWSRRDFLKIGGTGVAGAALLGVAGCGGGGGGAQGGTGGGGGNGIVSALETEPSILNTFITGGDAAVSNDVTNGILEAPLQVMPDLSYAPLLADGEPEVVSEDPLVVEYRLKEGITFSDGEPLTSEDAKWTFQQIMNPDNRIVSRVGWEDIESFETPDERTVRITFSQPYAGWRDLLTSDILPKHIYEGENFNKALNNEIVGSGPFKFQEWNKGEDLTIVRNENYWGEPASLERVTFRFISETNTRIQSLRSGEVDFIAERAEQGTFDRLGGIPNTTVQDATGTVWGNIAFNVEKVTDKRFRQAIAHGINRDQMNSSIMQRGLVTLNSVLVPDQDPYFTPAWEQYGGNPDMARQLVQELESEGFTPEITFTASTGSQLLDRLSQIMQQQLEDVGITVNLNLINSQEFLSRRLPEGDFEMGFLAWSASPDPSITTLFSGNQIPPDGQNYYRYSNEEVTRLLEESDRTIDEGQRAELLKQAQELMAEDVPVIPVYQGTEVYAHPESLQGPEVNPTIAGPYWNVGEWSLQS